MLINGKTGIIDNAAKAHIETGATDIRNNEITNVSIYVTPEGTICCSEEGKLEVFNLQGIQVPGHNLTHGVYIVKHTSESGQTTMRKIRFKNYCHKIKPILLNISRAEINLMVSALFIVFYV